MKQKTCKVCKCKFVPLHPLQPICTNNDFACAKEKFRRDRIKKEAKEATKKRKEYRDEKEKQKTRADWMREAQQAFNAYIRERDKQAGDGCISCGARTGKENAGHYCSVGSKPELRFCESNVNLQCERCNSYLSGNLINYRINLVKKIGLAKVEWLEGPHEPKKYQISDLQEIKRIYKEKLKSLNKSVA